MSNDLDAILKAFGGKPDDEAEAAAEIIKATDGLAKYMVNPARSVDEVLAQAEDFALRPKTLEDIVGQDHIKGPLRVSMRAAKRTDKPLGHTIFFGPSGLGKTTFASVIAREMQTLLIMDTGPQLSSQKLTYYCSEIIKAWESDPANPQRVTFFVDEAHKLPTDAITVLLPLLEDFRFLSALHTPPFTFVAATTNPGDLPQPFLQRFHSQYHFDYYGLDDITTIIRRNVAKIWEFDLETDEGKEKAAAFLAQPEVAESIELIASRSRGVPRMANRILRHVWEYAVGHPEEEPDMTQTMPLNPEIVRVAMQAHGIDRFGLTHADRQVLRVMVERFHGRHVGVDALASAIGEYADTLKSVIEPYLVRAGLINRTLRGRELTIEGRKIALLAVAGIVEY